MMLVDKQREEPKLLLSIKPSGCSTGPVVELEFGHLRARQLTTVASLERECSEPCPEGSSILALVLVHLLGAQRNSLISGSGS
jgi:hypothetical protein